MVALASITPNHSYGESAITGAQVPPLLGLMTPPQSYFPTPLQPLASKLPLDPTTVIKETRKDKSPTASLLRGYAELLVGEPESALSSFSLAKSHRSAQPYALYGEAVAQKDAGRFDRALALARDGLWFRGRDTQIPEAPFLLLIGYLELKLDREELGKVTIQKAIKADPSYAPTLFLWASLPTSGLSMDQKVSLLKTAMQSPSFTTLSASAQQSIELNGAETLLAGANRKFGKGDIEQARTIASKYQEAQNASASDRIRATSIVVRALLALEQISEAKKALNNAKRVWPTSQELQRLTSQLSIEQEAHQTLEDEKSEVGTETKKTKEKGSGKSRPSRSPKATKASATDTVPEHSQQT